MKTPKIRLPGLRRNSDGPPPERFRMNDANVALGNITTDDYDREPAPIVSVSVGSAGMRRTALWRRKMDNLGCAGRIQSMVAYDCNRTNIQEWVRAATASGVMDKCIVPAYLPFSEGFLRQPNFFIDHYGPIERDLERIIDAMEQKASEAGVRPQLILEWIGFGGHARISYLFHVMLTERFPGARILPVYCIPDDRVLEQNIREYRLWEEAMDIIGHVPSIITDNRCASNLRTLDERVATALAAAEACYRFRPEYGTMAETASTFALHGSRWLGLQITDIPYLENAADAEVHDWKAPDSAAGAWREARAAVTARAQAIKEAIWRIADPENDEHHAGYLGHAQHGDEQRIYCLLPFHPEITDAIKDDVEDQLRREVFNGPYPGTKVCFAPGNANYTSRPTGFTYGHICKIYSVESHEHPPSVARVLDPDNDYRGSRRRVLARGEEMMQQLGMPLTSIEGSGGRNGAPQVTRTQRQSRVPETPPMDADMGDGPAPLLANAGSAVEAGKNPPESETR